MKEIFDYINNNSFLTTIIGVIVGGLITSLTTIYTNKKNIKERKKEEYNKEKKRQYENKAELKLIENYENSNINPNIEVFFAPFEVKYKGSHKDYEMIYPEGIRNKNNHRYKDYYLKNIGNSDINQLDICATFKNHNILVDYKFLNSIVDEKFVEYNYCYDKKIFKNEQIMLRVYYLDGFQMCHPLSCSIAILFKDSYDNLWEQPFWYEKDNIYEPNSITSKQYRSYVTINDAMDCFENPYLW